MADNINDRGFDDADAMGKVGENHYIKVLERRKERGRIKGYMDLREHPLFKLVDIDFAVFTGDKEYTELDIVRMVLNRNHEDDCCLIDVKVDADTLTTGNVYLEWTAHLKPGCFGTTHADKWVYYAIEKGEKDVKKLKEEDLRKAWSVNMPKLRKLIGSRDKMEVVRNGKQVWRPHYCKSETKENFGYLMNIEYLVENGVMKELNICQTQ